MFSREEIIREHEEAAGYHWAILEYWDEHPDEKTTISLVYGEPMWHRWWYQLHIDTADYIRGEGG